MDEGRAAGDLVVGCRGEGRARRLLCLAERVVRDEYKLKRVT